MNSGYYALIDGRRYEDDEILHFVLNPDPDRPYMGTGFRVVLSDVLANLRQAAATKRGFMSDKWKPSVIIRVADFPDITQEGRRKVLDDFAGPLEAGEPWIVPTDMMEVQTVKPLSLNDLALNDSVTLDKKTVASMIGVPLYVVGAGAYNRDEYNAAIRTTVMNTAQILQAELTRKLLISPKRYFSLSPRNQQQEHRENGADHQRRENDMPIQNMNTRAARRALTRETLIHPEVRTFYES